MERDSTAQTLGNIVWLASYPKSGNTWVRAILTGMNEGDYFFDVNRLDHGAQPYHVSAATAVFACDPRWMVHQDLPGLRRAIISWQSQNPTTKRSSLAYRKTHEAYPATSDADLFFPTENTRAAILIVRDPRDVVTSYADFFGVTIDDAITRMAEESGGLQPRASHMHTVQNWSSWSDHARSWLEKAPFPVHVLRYEDLHTSGAQALGTVLDDCGIEVDPGKLHAAFDRASFQRLQKQEQEDDFRERSMHSPTFFRRGVAGAWVDDLTPEQIARLEYDHHEVMERLGYQLSMSADERDRHREVYLSNQRHAGGSVFDLPAEFDITVRNESLPDELPGARFLRRFIQITENEILVTLMGGNKILARNGEEIIVDTPGPAGHDNSWIVHGWGVTLIMLQRGRLSLHAMTMKINGEYVAIAGRRGAGKSTTGMALRRKGHALLTDDVGIVDVHDTTAWLTPFARNVHLLEDTVRALGMDFNALPLLSGGRNKVAFRAETPAEKVVALTRMVIIEPTTDVFEPEVEPLHGYQRVTALTPHVSRDGLGSAILGPEKFFALTTDLANAVPTYRLRRPADSWSLDRVCQIIEDLTREA